MKSKIVVVNVKMRMIVPANMKVETTAIVNMKTMMNVVVYYRHVPHCHQNNHDPRLLFDSP